MKSGYPESEMTDQMAIEFSIESKIDKLRDRLPEAEKLMTECRVCPRNCLVDRRSGETGICGMPAELVIASANLHYGEEPPISGRRGSGTIFLSGCNLSCIYCQNYPISQFRVGEKYSAEEAADMMIDLQKRGAHNINFVTPSHYIPSLMKSLLIAYEKGLRIPLVYNSSGYDSLESLRLLEGIIDIYMPDMRYSDPECSRRYSGAPDYPEINRAAIKEMYKQVGTLQIKNGIAVGGLLIRHLVLPENIAGSSEIFRFIAREISPETYVAVMSQYFPAHKACIRNNQGKLLPLARKITAAEYDLALEAFEKAGLNNGFIQPFSDS